MSYRIYPPIGIARVGNSPDHFIGPERPGSRGVESDGNGGETEVTSFKDGQYRVKRQAVRFRIFEVDDATGDVTLFDPPEGTKITWTAKLANAKDGVRRADDPPAPPTPGTPFRPVRDPNRADHIIEAQATIHGASADPSKLAGAYRGHPVDLGELRTDAQQRLVFLGATGKAASPVENAPIGSEVGGGGYYNNTGWHDDVGDGVIGATIELPGSAPVEATPAWVMVAPPDFAPDVTSPFTLYDLLVHIADREGWIDLPEAPDFARDIQPILARVNSLQYVNLDPWWRRVKTDWPYMSKNDASNDVDRGRAVDAVLHAVDAFTHRDASYSNFMLGGWQKRYLEDYRDGTFETTWPPAAGAEQPSHEELTRAALDNSVGACFFPGIEAGMIMRDTTIYAQPFDFRIDPTQVNPGDLTALMALPWQADFLKCGTDWWPTQRPNRVPLEAGGNKPWQRGPDTHREWTTEVMKLGVIQRGTGVTQHETGRDPSLG